MANNDDLDPAVRRNAVIFLVLGIALLIGGIIVMIAATYLFYIAGCMILGGLIGTAIGGYVLYHYQKDKNRVRTIQLKEATQGTTTQQIEYGQTYQPQSTGPPPPTGGWQSDPYPQSNQPGPPLPGQPQQPAYGQPAYGQPHQPAYRQPSYGQPQQPIHGQPPHGQAEPPPYGQQGYGGPQDQPAYGQPPPPYGQLGANEPYRPYSGQPPP
ncbi:uncharacterized protein LOC102809072 [Saccoglossus kowalevskii]|uniref:Glutenin, high molecular weight subunit DY10-like n=1 Tax=Saccoglossus kowalevskii TaxID=10224 RepID=A0ABM0LXI0_SACKO|nr:PREDICTED: glutenin, high molecular weight subunit DY10-like [Saccoglossus kowalevskii]